jgi:glycogen debranching enzyme
MVLFARNLDTMSTLLGKATGIPSFAQDAAELSHLINRHMWDPGRQFYFDLTLEGQRAPIKTVAGFWPLLAQVASPAQGRTLVKELSNPDSFGRMHRVPTLSADSSGYDSKGGYWRGAVWAPTDTMVIRGLENYGYRELARQIVLNHMEMLGKVFQQTGTIWENYAPDAVAPGHPAKKDFVGWSGIGPIMYLLEYAVGLQANAPKNKLTWDLRSDQRVGCERFRFNGHLVTLAAKPADGRGRQISITSDGGFRLQVKRHGTSKVIEVHAGEQQFTLR